MAGSCWPCGPLWPARDGVIVCGGLGPTQDDITREAIAEVMNVPLVRDEADREPGSQGSSPPGAARCRTTTSGRPTSRRGDRSSSRCGAPPRAHLPGGRKVVYAVPGVPHEMAEMFERGILPDLRRRMAAAGEEAVIVSRVLRTWGPSESALAEALQDVSTLWTHRAIGAATAGAVTIAFLASGIEGIKVRLTARAPDEARVGALLDAEETQVRAVLASASGTSCSESTTRPWSRPWPSVLIQRGLTLGVAESLTGGLIASRLVDVPGRASGSGAGWSPTTRRSSTRCWASPGAGGVRGGRRRHGGGGSAGARGRRRAGHHRSGRADRTGGSGTGHGLRGIGPAQRRDGDRELHLPGDRPRVRQYSAISALDLLRRALLARTPAR